MENRTALRGAGISKGLIALLAVIVVMCLGVMAAYLAKGVSTPAGATQTRTVATQADSDRNSAPVDSFDGSGHGYVP